MAKHPILFRRFAEVWRSLFGSSPRRLTRVQARKRVTKAVKSRGSEPDATSTAAISANGVLKVRSRSSDGWESVSRSARHSEAKGGNFWSSLFLVHPWLLVGGLWLTFILMIAIALIGLSNPGRELVLEPVSSMSGPPLSAPDAAAASRLSSQDDGPARQNQRDPAAIAPVDTAAQDMPIWPLWIMVLACAGGCLLMSHHNLLANLAHSDSSRRSQRRGVSGTVSTHRPVVRTTTIGSSGRHRRKQRRLAAHRPASQVMAFRTGQKLRHTWPRTTRPVASKSVSFAVNSEPAKSVTVVPAEESSPLDWKEGSLAHHLDVRQKRSVNSFL